MRNVYIMLFSFIFSLSVFAQDIHPFTCGTVIDETSSTLFSSFNTASFSGSTDLEYLETFPPISFNIYFWIINKDDGSGVYNITEDNIQICMDKINKMYKPMGICFVLQGHDTINETSIYENEDWTNILNYVQTHSKVMSNCLNVYIPRTLGSSGVTFTGNNQLAVTQDSILGVWEYIPGTTLGHEIAHDFGLSHPWGSSNATVATFEHVTRDPNDPNYNADTTADKVTDTPAMVSFRTEAANDHVPISDIIDLSTCEYTGNLEDELGVPFVITPNDVGNPMGYTYEPCGTGFTVGQGIRIREYIDDNPSALSVLAMTDNVCVNCLEDLTISQEVRASESFRVVNTINASSEIIDDIQVIYAGEEIFLEPGFETGAGAGVFLAKVSPCDLDAGRSTNVRMNSLSSIENEMAEEINLFYIAPNPANNAITVMSTQGIQSIIITSMDGKVLYNGTPDAQTTSTNVAIENYSNGIYNVTIITPHGKKQTKKLVKN